VTRIDLETLLAAFCLAVLFAAAIAATLSEK